MKNKVKKLFTTCVIFALSSANVLAESKDPISMYMNKIQDNWFEIALGIGVGGLIGAVFNKYFRKDTSDKKKTNKKEAEKEEVQFAWKKKKKKSKKKKK